MRLSLKRVPGTFRDLDLPHPEELQSKARLGVEVNSLLDERRLTRRKEARLLGIKKAKVIALRKYKLDEFSMCKLMRFVTALAYDVVIELRPCPASEAPARMSAMLEGSYFQVAKGQ